MTVHPYNACISSTSFHLFLVALRKPTPYPSHPLLNHFPFPACFSFRKRSHFSQTKVEAQRQFPSQI